MVVGLLLCSGGRADSDPSAARLSKKIDNIRFTDATGKPFALYDFKDRKAIVVVFLSFDCPVSTSYSEPLADLARAYGDRVAFVGVATNPDEDAAQVEKRREEYQLPFPVFRDDGYRAADALKAETTPEAFILDRNFVLRYRGRIDDGYRARLKKKPAVTREDLRTALDEVLAGKDVTEPITRAVGCAIRRETQSKSTGPVTYHRDVLPILQANCQGCHCPGEVGPFSLMTYRQAVTWAGDIKEYTQSRKMPPWKPVDGPPFHGERKLTERETATLAAWADGGTPEGDPKQAPPPRQFTEGWQLGKPDLVMRVEDDFQLGASGKDLFRCFVLPTGLTEDRWVTAVEVRPGNPRVVHHALLFIDAAGQGRKLAEKEQQRRKEAGEVDRGPGYSMSMGIGFMSQGGLGGWAPGQRARQLPEDTGYFLPRASDVVMQVHYHRDGRAEKDRTEVGLYFAKQPAARRFQGMVIAGRTVGSPPVAAFPNFFVIPRDVAHYPLHGGVVVDQDCELHSVMPHMHLLGKEIWVRLTPPDGGRPATLVAINDWDYNWQETYFFKESIPVKAGTVIEVDAFFDNSAANPNNPSEPPKKVTFGQETTDEMCFVFLGVTTDGPGRVKFHQQRAGDEKEQ
jgi:hypothetical protein